MADWERTADPWFLINTDPGHPGGYHVLPHLGATTRTSRWPRCASTCAGSPTATTIDRPTEEVLAERDRITASTASCSPEAERATFDETVALARLVFVYIEEHVLYIEHWMWATFWAKSKELSRALAAMGEFDEPEDMFFLRRYEVAEAIYDCVAGWSVGSRPRGADYWRPIIARRREIYDGAAGLGAAAGARPAADEVNEPFTVMLWGITTSTVGEWLTLRRRGRAHAARHRRLARRRRGPGAGRHARLGAAVGAARARSWSARPRRRRGRRCSPAIAATVSDVGGIMSHTAIVCREYGMPAVVGTGQRGRDPAHRPAGAGGRRHRAW